MEDFSENLGAYLLLKEILVPMVPVSWKKYYKYFHLNGNIHAFL